MRTRIALICYFRMVAHKAACHTLSKAFFEISEDMLQIVLMLEVLFTQDFKAEDLFCGVSLALNPVCSSAIISDCSPELHC